MFASMADLEEHHHSEAHPKRQEHLCKCGALFVNAGFLARHRAQRHTHSGDVDDEGVDANTKAVGAKSATSATTAILDTSGKKSARTQPNGLVASGSRTTAPVSSVAEKSKSAETKRGKVLPTARDSDLKKRTSNGEKRKRHKSVVSSSSSSTSSSSSSYSSSSYSSSSSSSSYSSSSSTSSSSSSSSTAPRRRRSPQRASRKRRRDSSSSSTSTSSSYSYSSYSTYSTSSSSSGSSASESERTASKQPVKSKRASAKKSAGKVCVCVCLYVISSYCQAGTGSVAWSTTSQWVCGV
jgi:hypothetical protein